MRALFNAHACYNAYRLEKKKKEKEMVDPWKSHKDLNKDSEKQIPVNTVVGSYRWDRTYVPYIPKQNCCCCRCCCCYKRHGCSNAPFVEYLNNRDASVR